MGFAQGRARCLAFIVVAAVGLLALRPAHATPPSGQRAEAASGNFTLRMPGVAADAASGETFDLGSTANGLRYCRFLPGFSVPLVLPPDAPPPAPPSLVLPPQTSVPAPVTDLQVEILNQLDSYVTHNYVVALDNGKDWDEIYFRYLDMVLAGLTQEDFYKAMDAMVQELGDEHSQFMTPQEVIKDAEETVNGAKFVGIGVLARSLTPGGPMTIIAVYPGSPAQEGGLLPHDLILDANGLPPVSAEMVNNLVETAGTTVTLRVQRPGGGTFTKVLTRRSLSGNVPVDGCMVAGTHIGYINITSLLDLTVDDQVRALLQKMAATGPLSGLILDNREDSGGFSSMAEALLGFFLSGNQGAFVTRTQTFPLAIQPENIGNTQAIPLVVLVGTGTASFGEVTSGVLQRSGRAKVVGVTTRGNVEILQAADFVDGSRAWIAARTFQPVGLPAGIWEDTGIVPDVMVNSPWHLFTEANDPALAKAIDLLPK